MTREIKIPGPDHPITITATPGRVVVGVNGVTVADTTAALTLQEDTYPAVQYLPLADIDPAVLKPSSTNSYCPFKGEATYYSLAMPDAELTDVIWAYPQPHDAVREIAGYAAFYPDRVDLVIIDETLPA